MECIADAFADNWIAITSLVTAVVTVTIGLLTYAHSKRVERNKILLDLHQRFMDTDKYSLIRMKMERSDSELLQMVKYVVDNPNIPFDDETTKGTEIPQKLDAELMERFDEYLGFFELIAHLWKRVGFQIEDIEGIFGYYLGRLKVGAIWAYVTHEYFAFTALIDLVEEVAKRKAQITSNRTNV